MGGGIGSQFFHWPDRRWPTGDPLRRTDSHGGDTAKEMGTVVYLLFLKNGGYSDKGGKIEDEGADPCPPPGGNLILQGSCLGWADQAGLREKGRYGVRDPIQGGGRDMVSHGQWGCPQEGGGGREYPQGLAPWGMVMGCAKPGCCRGDAFQTSRCNGG